MNLSLFDWHCDTANEMLRQTQSLMSNHLAVSLENASVFFDYTQVMALWTEHRLSDEEGWERYHAMLENLKADMNENLCSIACEDCPFNDLHFYAKSGCRVTDFIDSHIAKIKENKQ